MSRVPVTAAADFGRVAVLLGGTSAEREISLLTGEAVLAALRRRGVDAEGVDPASGLEPLLSGGFDRAWIALHGRGGEDGLMQGALETLGMPYTGSGVLGSSLAMDKLRSKQLFVAWALATPRWRVMRAADEAASVVAEFGLPLIVKPAGEGSSVGMSKVTEAARLPAAWAEANRWAGPVLVEEWVSGEEYSVGVLQGDTLPAVRIETPRAFYDYEAKYFSDETRYHCPCGLDPAREADFARLARLAFEAVGASGWGRVDFLLPADGVPRFLEVNTIPGMTSHSLVPMGARQAGIDFDELAWRVLETSFGRATAGEGTHGTRG
ncbi:D-alanine--D-alanine ligase [Wenzhouxiangella sp. XN24]|uniref:D-alanine--D-alanine ligase n=1 Tax=Wenzhouxiangella sp. XN24 TaxID=2713569 RepID=UPI0013ECCACC|nr:D-alanine--D-alanine ligase [Wenzhouxiangella sp. XN24]NGX15226.1 D-alanine--D-alanine ligase [Wenzhouxiangella sp. XN24]